MLRYVSRVCCDAGVPLYGRGPSQATQADFFLDLCPLLGNKDTLAQNAALLDDHLANRTTLVADDGITIADLAVFESITGQEKERHARCTVHSPARPAHVTVALSK